MDRRALLLAVSILCCAAAILPASAQHFKQIPGSLAQIAAGRSEVWGLDPSSAVYRFSSGTKTFARVGTIKLSRIAVGGGSALQADQVWGVSAANLIYRYNFTTKAFSRIPGTLVQIVVGEGNDDSCHPYEVWGINAGQLIYRYNYCTLTFDQIPGSLTVVATGGGAVWGLNGAAQIFYYDRANTDPRFIQVPGSLQQITVGASDVWGLDGEGTIYRLDSVKLQFVLFMGGNHGIAAGGDGVWGLYPGDGTYSSAIFRFGPYPSRPYFEMTFSQIAVGYGAGVWVVDPSHHVYALVRP
jgi:hypothetical protein